MSRDNFDLGQALQELKSEIKFPSHVMDGAAGEFARTYSEYIESPPPFLFMGYLGCLGTLLADTLTLESEIRPQPRLYLLLLGESSDTRKSTTLKVTSRFFKDSLTDFNSCWGVGSAEGLAEVLKDNRKVLLILDEFNQFIKKCKIEGSVLLPCVTSLFENNHYQSMTKTTKINLEDVYLCMMAASTIETYDSSWDPAFTDIGFINRIFIVPGDTQKQFAIPEIIPDSEKERLKGNLRDVLQHAKNYNHYTLKRDAWERFNEWYLNLSSSIHAKRLDTYALRFMPLLAVNEQKEVIDAEIVEKVIDLMNWQLKVRKLYAPFDADNKIARMEERIRRLLSIKQLTETELKKAVHYERSGLFIFNAAKTNLLKSSEIIFNRESKTFFSKASS